MAGGKRLMKPPKKTLPQKLLIALVVVALLMCGSAAAWRLIVRKPAVAAAPAPVEVLAEEAPVEDLPEAEPEPLLPAEEEPEPKPEPEPEPEPEIDPFERREDVWNFLLVGMDASGGNTDTLLLLQYDVKNQKVNVASIARDTRVNVSRSLKKINAAWALGDGIDSLKAEVSDTFGVPIDYYIKVNIRVFRNLIDAMGGIDFYVPCSMNYDDPLQNLSIHFSKGMQHLNGQQTVEVCRFRQNNNSPGYGDEGRMQTQRAVLTTAAKQLLSWKNLTLFNNFVQIVTDNVTTDLSPTDILWFAEQARSFETENLNAMSMPVEWHNPYMYLVPDETLEIVNTYFNPYTTDRTADMLDIITR